MANSNRPFGLRPVKHRNGADWDGRANQYFLHSSNTDAIRVGDVVTKNLTLAQIDPTYGLPSVSKAASTNIIQGVVVGVGTSYGGPYANPADLDAVYAPATKTRHYYLLVCDDPGVIYEIQEQSVASQITGAHIGCNQILVVGSPAAAVRFSTTQVAGVTTSTPAATTFDVKLLGLSQVYDNGARNTFGAYAKWLVTLTQPALGLTAGQAAAS